MNHLSQIFSNGVTSMPRYALVCVICCACLFLGARKAFAQEAIDTEFKIQLYVIAAEFMSTIAPDTKKPVRLERCVDCKTKEEVLRYLKKLEPRVQSFEKKVIKLVESLEKQGKKDRREYADTVAAQLTSKKEHKYRTEGENKENFELFKKRLDELVAGPKPTATPSPEVSLTAAGHDAAPALSASTESEAKDSEDSSSTWLMMGGLLLSLLLSGTALFFATRKKENTAAVGNETTNIDAQLLQSLTRQMDAQQKETAKLRTDLKELENKLQEHQKETAGKNAKATTLPLSAEIQKNVPPVEKPKMKYAEIMDMDNGTPASSLTDEPSNSSVFEVTLISPTEAIFAVWDNERAQKRALADILTFLAKICEFSNTSGGQTRVRTITPGRLNLNGDIWHITSKPLISIE